MKLFVSVDGSDKNDGSKKAPFATVVRARQALRDIRGKTAVDESVSIEIGPGFYELPEALVFDSQDSGRPDAPVTYRAAAGQKPVFSGGRRISGWTVNEKGWWEVSLPDVASGSWNFSQLFVNGERRCRARVQKDGYAFIADEAEPSPNASEKGPGYDRFRFNEGEFSSSWKNLRDVEVHCFHLWSTSRLRIQEVDEAEQIVEFTGTTNLQRYFCSLFKGTRYIIENVYEALSEPGEWYLDRCSGLLTYIPMPGEAPDDVEVIAPYLDSLLQLSGDVENREWVQHLQFKNLAFAHAGWVSPETGVSCPQAEVNVPAALSLEGARHCLFDGCDVSHCGTWAVQFGRGAKHNIIRNGDLTDLGGGGVKIGETYFPSGRQPYVEGDCEAHVEYNTVEDCLISQGGRMHPAACGVWVGHAAHNRVAHNEIFDLYYTGISVGWCWGYMPSQAHHNLLEYNHIHHLGQHVLSDMGGFYLLGVSPGTVIRGNVIHDVHSFDYGGHGIYFDQATTDVEAYHNLTYRCDEPFMQHFGRDNHVFNNIFAFGGNGQIERGRGEGHASFIFERNIVYWDNHTPLLGKCVVDNQMDDLAGMRLDRNIYFNSSGRPVLLNEEAFADFRRQCGDEHSLVVDPLFVDPENGDFSLQPGSPAAQIDFESWDIERAGLLTERAERPAEMSPAFPIDLDASAEVKKRMGREFDVTGEIG